MFRAAEVTGEGCKKIKKKKKKEVKAMFILGMDAGFDISECFHHIFCATSLDPLCTMFDA